MRTYNIRLENVVLALTVMFVVLLGLDLIGRGIPLLRPLVGVFLFGALPGAVLMRIAGVDPKDTRIWILYSVGVSLVIAMAIGLVLNLLLPLVGVESPLSTIPLAAPYVIGFSVFSGWGLRTGGVSPFKISLPTRLEELRFAQLVAILLPIMSIFAVTALNIEKIKLPMIAFLILISIIPIVVVAGVVKTVDLSGLVLGMSLAVLWHKSLWTEFAYAGHVSVVKIFESGYWPFAGESLLVNAILMPSLSRLLGVEILTQMKVVMPVFVALIPLALFTAFDRYTTPKTAFLGTTLFIFAHPFYLQYPSVPRAAFPVFFLSLIAVVVADAQTAGIHRRGFSLLFAAALIVSHYGTSYYILFATIGVVAGLYLIGRIDAENHNEGYGDEFSSAFKNGGARITELSIKKYSTPVFTRSYMLFYSVLVSAWYLFVGQGGKFELLTEQIVKAYISLFIEQGGQGSTTARIVTDYGSRSIRLSKYLYLTLALLIGVGVTISLVRRFIGDSESMFSDEHLVMSAILLALFGGTIVISRAWGGGRPLMIVLTFCAIYSLIALIQGVNAVRWIDRRISESIRGSNSDVALRGAKNGAMLAFAVLLASFFVLNAGVMSAIVFGGEAPSNVPAANPDARYGNTDIQTHVWVTNQRNERYQIYGDNTVYNQATDWMVGEVAAQSKQGRGSYRFKPKFSLDSINDPGVESGYVVLAGHNVRDDRVAENYVTSRPIGAYELSLNQRSRIYTSSSGAVYFNRETFNTSYIDG